MDRAQAIDFEAQHGIRFLPSRDEFRRSVRCVAALKPEEDRQTPFAKHETLRLELSLLHYACCLRKSLRAFLPRNRRSEEHTSELQSLRHLVCRLMLEKKNRH